MKLHGSRYAILGSTALALSLSASGTANAQSESVGLEEIIVTAQKREQSLRDVPIAVTALGGDALQANRISSVADLSGLAPGLTTAVTAGGSQIPQFSMRGATGNGSVPGSDRTVGIYIDGVYVAASRGAIFDLPEIQRIEVLRGPQGTLFGRNSTAGAISITTRDPSGEIGLKANATVGNYDQYRFGVSFDTPQIGPFSGTLSFQHSERRGDIRNTSPGVLWDRTSGALPRIAKIQRSARYLGSENAQNLFAALKFESGDFTTVYKYDRLRSTRAPEGTGFVGYDPDSPLIGNLLTALINSQGTAVPMASDGKRPKAAANGYVVEAPQRGDGHNLTSTLVLSDSLSIKNIFAYRTSFIFATTGLDGISSLPMTAETVAPLATFYGISGLAGQGIDVTDPANGGLVQSTIMGIAGGLQEAVGSPFVVLATQASGRTKQISDELQLNYQSGFLTATAGALWFNSKDRTAEPLQQNTPSFVLFPGGVVPNANIGETFNEVTSLAAYTQLEFHVTDQLNITLGGRVTKDKKTGSLLTGPDLDSLSLIVAPTYKKTKPSYLIGIDYKPNANTMLYAKHSTAFVSGGNTVGIPYRPETASSWEAGIKATLFNRRLQANFSAYHVKYRDVQGANSPTTPGMAEVVNAVTGDPNRSDVVGTFTFNNGDLKAKGFEFEFTAAPVAGLTLGGSLGYNDSDFSNVDPLILASNQGRYEQILLPDWTANFWAQYDTPPLGAGDMYLSFRADARWQSDMNLGANPDLPEYSTWAAAIREVPAYAVVNGRVALKDINLGGVNTELAVWGRNLTNNRSASYALNFGFMGAANYIPARTYGLDLAIRF